MTKDKMDVVIEKDRILDFLQALKASHRLYAPVNRGDVTCFAPVDDVKEVDLASKNTVLSPKELFLPQSQKMFECSIDPGSKDRDVLKAMPGSISPRVVVGIRPCDAGAFVLVDANFITPEYVDPWWREARKQTVLVGQGCQRPCTTCFCSTVGGGPFDETGLDVLLVDIGSALIARSVTEKGDSLLQGLHGFEEASSEQRHRAGDIAEKASQAMAPLENKVDISTLEKIDTDTLYDASLWEDIQASCINCGICTYLCPTCWCFDIQDEICGSKAVRMRNWDSCMFPLFTLHASGHNPRGTKEHRVRQRFMHKLKYYIDKYGSGVACVGCGRCIQHCPVNIDIRQVVKRMCQTKDPHQTEQVV